MKKILYYSWGIVRLALVIGFFWAIFWIEKNPEKCGQWYGKFQKWSLENFQNR